MDLLRVCAVYKAFGRFVWIIYYGKGARQGIAICMWEMVLFGGHMGGAWGGGGIGVGWGGMSVENIKNIFLD